MQQHDATVENSQHIRLRDWLKEQNMTASALSKDLGFFYSYVANMVAGSRTISDRFRWRFGEVYGFDVAERIFTEQTERAEQTEPAQ